MKKCTKCRKVKDGSEYYVRKNGYAFPFCRPCSYKMKRESLLKKYGTHLMRKVPIMADNIRERDKTYQVAKRLKNPGYKTEEFKLYRKKYPEKVLAQQILNRYVKKGLMDKKPCEICGEIKVHAHHSDYLEPLKVNWLCPVHHMEQHQRSLN